jgi:hypothetical protein
MENQFLFVEIHTIFVPEIIPLSIIALYLIDLSFSKKEKIVYDV